MADDQRRFYQETPERGDWWPPGYTAANDNGAASTGGDPETGRFGVESLGTTQGAVDSSGRDVVANLREQYGWWPSSQAKEGGGEADGDSGADGMQSP